MLVQPFRYKKAQLNGCCKIQEITEDNHKSSVQLLKISRNSSDEAIISQWFTAPTEGWISIKLRGRQAPRLHMLYTFPVEVIETSSPIFCSPLPNVNQTFKGNYQPTHSLFIVVLPHGWQNVLFPNQSNNILIMEIMASIPEIMGSTYRVGEQGVFPSPLISRVGGPSLQGSPALLSLSGDFYWCNSSQFSFVR